MKSTTPGFSRETIAMIFGLAVGYGLCGIRDASFPLVSKASAQVVGTVDRESWEYQTNSIDAASLQSMLTVMGADGWEVFSVTGTDGIIDTGHDGKSHLNTQRFEIFAKRKRR